MKEQDRAVRLADGPARVERYARESLRFLGRNLSGRIEATYLDAGVMNYVYRVATPDQTHHLKQALSRVKQHECLGPDFAGVSPHAYPGRHCKSTAPISATTASLRLTNKR